MAKTKKSVVPDQAVPLGDALARVAALWKDAPDRGLQTAYEENLLTMAPVPASQTPAAAPEQPE